MKNISRSSNRHRVQYLLLSCISGVFELGIPLLAYYIYKSPNYLLIATIGYQLAAFITKHQKLPLGICLISTALGIFLLLLVWPQPFCLYIFGTFLLSIGLHSARMKAKKQASSVSTATKRTARVLGFIISGFANKWIFVILSCFIIVYLFLETSQNGTTKNFSNPPKKLSLLAIIMTIHQMHYFVYCYVILFLIVTSLHQVFTFSGLLFSIGWLSYLAAESLLKKYKTHIVLICGHLSLVILLWVLYTTEQTNIWFLLSMWFLTGFGGGTVFCLRKSNQVLPNEERVELDVWEDVGHVVGVVLCVTITIFFNMKLCFLIGSGMALLTVILYVWWLLYIAKKSIRNLL